MVAPWEVRGDEDASPVLIEVPHAGLALEAVAASTMSSPAWAIAHDADLEVDVLFGDAPGRGATLLVAPLSRHVCDLNVDPERAVLAEGDVMVLHTASNGRRARLEAVPVAEAERRRRALVAPYHQTIADVMQRKRERFGRCVLVSAHSFPPSRGGAVLPDVVVGTRHGSSCADVYAETVERQAAVGGYAAARDEPFAGGYVVGRFGRPTQGWHALQVELRRDLYLDPKTLQRRPEGFAALRAWAAELVASLVTAASSAR